jgi:hypothetical protein
MEGRKHNVVIGYVIGVIVGAGIGGAIGYFGKCAGST